MMSAALAIPSTIGFGFEPGSVIVISGAASGIGRAAALQAAQVGLHVSAWDLEAGPLEPVLAEIRASGGSAHGVVADVSDAALVEAGFAEARSHGAVRHLLNNAGPGSAANLDFETALSKSLGSVRLMTETWLAHPPAVGASLVNIASVAGVFIGTSSDWYCAAKSGIVGYTRHLAAYRTSEVRANAVAPGMTDTPRMAGFAETEVGERILGRIPSHRMAKPSDIAWASLFLLSPLAGYINGVVLPVDGGWMVAQ